ncbi:MAG: NUDIX domain-containing protein [Actinomycetota bacterium]|nr:NUDIX domain-containing protein [Actinomycetota bacterium]
MAKPSRTQRLGAYAVVVSECRMLLTRISPIGYPAGMWTLPGGGVDHGESPHDAVRRELYEETGLVARSAALTDIHDVHVVDVGRDDQYEDYHGVHLLYVVDVDVEAPLEIKDVGGTTDRVAWVPITEIGSADYPVLEMVTYALGLSPGKAQDFGLGM